MFLVEYKKNRWVNVDKIIDLLFDKTTSGYTFWIIGDPETRFTVETDYVDKFVRKINAYHGHKALPNLKDLEED